jgi:aminodeoxyfutalosine deaminase
VHFITADRIFNGEFFLPPQTVLVVKEGGELKDIISAEVIDGGKVQKFAGTITPGFINAHCHSELSHLKNIIPEKTGLPEFGRRIISGRNTFRKEEMKEHILEADKEMWANGIVAVGDICNTDDSFEMKANSKIFYHSFIELLGFNPLHAMDAFNKGKQLFEKVLQEGFSCSLAPHAPYSCSVELIKLISRFNAERQLPGSIHNQESEEEVKFFNGKPSGFHELYDFLQMDISWFRPPLMSSLQYYADALTQQKFILVHNVFTHADDVEAMKNRDIYWCLCPNANLYIEGSKPELNIFSGAMQRVCIGTDSLASNHRLDVLSEVNTLLKQNSHLLPDELLSCITATPADALGLSKSFGRLMVGRKPGLNLINIKDGQILLSKKIIGGTAL